VNSLGAGAGGGFQRINHPDRTGIGEVLDTTLSLQHRKSEPVGLAFRLLVVGSLLGLCALATCVKTAVDAYKENAEAKWPKGIATITRQAVGESFVGRYKPRSVWYIQSELRYSVGGQELTSSVRSRTSSSEKAVMRKWVARHQPGTFLAIRFDPRHHDIAIPDASDMPESGPEAPDDLKMSLLFLLPSIALITVGRALQRG
jgi:hypothetical protein